MFNNKVETGNTDVEQVIEDVLPAIARLPHGMTVKTVDLFERVVWMGASMSDHKKYGRIVANLARESLLPLSIIESTSSNHRQFVIDHH